MLDVQSSKFNLSFQDKQSIINHLKQISMLDIKIRKMQEGINVKFQELKNKELIKYNNKINYFSKQLNITEEKHDKYKEILKDLYGEKFIDIYSKIKINNYLKENNIKFNEQDFATKFIFKNWIESVSCFLNKRKIN